MKKVTLIIDNEYSDMIAITTVGHIGNTVSVKTNVHISAHEIKDGDVITIAPDKKFNSESDK
mgnify:CR=1 FL=1